MYAEIHMDKGSKPSDRAEAKPASPNRVKDMWELVKKSESETAQS